MAHDTADTSRDELVGSVAIELGLVDATRLDEARAAQQAVSVASGVEIPLAEFLVGKEIVGRADMRRIEGVISSRMGDARFIGTYEVLDKLGQGGMGAVYRARSRRTGDSVALKILLPAIASPEYVRRFRREAETAKRCRHRNIVRFLEAGYDDRHDVHYCVFECFDGTTLRERVEDGGVIEERLALSVARQVGEALQCAHERGVVHRDIKPSNIMLGAGGGAKLLDLGLAKPTVGNVSHLTQTGAFVGTPHYASPEMIRHDGPVDVRSDIYSLGASLYYAVTGQPPFDGETIFVILHAHAYEQITWPAEINATLSEGICLLIARMMAKSAADRYQTPAELIADLDMVARGTSPTVGERILVSSTVAQVGKAAARGKDQRTGTLSISESDVVSVTRRRSRAVARVFRECTPQSLGRALYLHIDELRSPDIREVVLDVSAIKGFTGDYVEPLMLFMLDVRLTVEKTLVQCTSKARKVLDMVGFGVFATLKSVPPSKALPSLEAKPKFEPVTEPEPEPEDEIEPREPEPPEPPQAPARGKSERTRGTRDVSNLSLVVLGGLVLLGMVGIIVLMAS